MKAVSTSVSQHAIARRSPARLHEPSANVRCFIDNNETPGCEDGNLNCYPLTWKTTPEYYQDAGVTWNLYQDSDNFDDNPLAWFKQYQQAANGSQLAERGMAYQGLEQFYQDAAAGKLPQISYIVGPAELSEHPPYMPQDGAWLQQKVVDAVTSSPLYNSTALIISYDETGGWGDHVTPYHSPSGTAGEWIEDPYGEFGYVYTGPGFRLPFYIVSPWTRGGNVYVEHADHNSQIKFVEEWLAAKGKNVTTEVMAPWRRANMADLTKAFDFAHPDYTLPNMPNASFPSLDAKGNWNGYAVCEAEHKTTRPPVPFGKQNESTALIAEEGFKLVRGQLTEGRFLVFESDGYAVSVANGKLVATQATPKHDKISQRFVAHQRGSMFSLNRAQGGESLGIFTINDLGNGRGHSIKRSDGKYLAIKDGKLSSSGSPRGFQLFSVTYNS